MESAEMDASIAKDDSAEQAIWAELTEDTRTLDRLEDDTLGQPIKVVFVCWTVIFGLVGAQMGWLLRPLIGSPDEPFVWFCPRESNFFEGVWRAIEELLLQV